MPDDILDAVTAAGLELRGVRKTYGSFVADNTDHAAGGRNLHRLASTASKPTFTEVVLPRIYSNSVLRVGSRVRLADAWRGKI